MIPSNYRLLRANCGLDRLWGLPFRTENSTYRYLTVRSPAEKGAVCLLLKWDRPLLLQCGNTCF
jgi:hypothetical protein